MKNNRNDLDAMLSLLREHPPTGELLSRDDVRRTLEEAHRRDGTGMVGLTRKGIGLMVVAGGLLLSGAALLMMQQQEPVRIAPLNTQPSQSGERTTSATTEATQRIALTTPAAASTSIAPSGASQPVSLLSTSTVQKHTPLAATKNAYAALTDSAHTEQPAQLNDQTSPAVAHDRQKSGMPHDSTLNVSGMGFIELTADELERLGIDVTSGRVVLSTESTYRIRNEREAREMLLKGYDTTGGRGLRQNRVRIDTFEVSHDVTALVPNAKTYSRLSPILIAQQWVKGVKNEGSHIAYYNDSPLLAEYFDSPDLLQKEIFSLYNVLSPEDVRNAPDRDTKRYPLSSRLVPVYLRMGDEQIEGTTWRRGSDIYLWYLPTREFIEALPDRYRVPLLDELDALAHVESNRLDTKEACECITGGSTFLDICRSRSGAVVSASLAPNPAREASTVNFRLTSERHVTITLHDINGRYLSTLEGEQQLNAGNHQTRLDLANVQQGTYLVVVRTDQQEQAVQRLIVQ